MRSILILGLVAHALCAQSSREIRQAVDRALPPLEHSTAAFVAKRACVSCHHNILFILMFHLAQEHGVAIDPAVLSAVEAKTFRALRGPAAFDDAVQAVSLNDPTPDDSYLSDGCPCLRSCAGSDHRCLRAPTGPLAAGWPLGHVRFPAAALKQRIYSYCHSRPRHHLLHA
jgi:hypothetical protein